MTDETVKTTVDEMVRAHEHNDDLGVLFEDQRWTYREWVHCVAARAALALDMRRPDVPFHIGFLFDNTPELTMWLGAGAVTGATMVGINPTRQGAELARDINYTECQMIVTESRYRALLDGLDLDIPADRIIDVDSAAYASLLEPYADAPLPPDPVPADRIFVLLFTSGTSGAPKAVVTTQGRFARIGKNIADNYQLGPHAVCYQAMPMFHSNALFAGWSPALYSGAVSALRRKFSASNFLPDVRTFGATFFNYVGKPLSYVLATPECPDDADNTLQVCFGNEGAEHDLERFATRFGCRVQDNYGSTEGGTSVQRVPNQPKGALGIGPPGTCILDPETLEEKPPARFDDAGRLLNPDECIGEIVNKNIGAGFEGYYKNDEANTQRMRNGWYWSGDLGYRDTDGWFYFAGRDFEWLRVDGENFAAAPIERILVRYPGVQLAAVYAVPDTEVGDQVMASLLMSDPEAFDPADFDEFLEQQPDLGTKWSPRYLRVTTELPLTHTAKILKRPLRRERWESSDPVWFRPKKGMPLQRITPADVDAILSEFEARGRLTELDKV